MYTWKELDEEFRNIEPDFRGVRLDVRISEDEEDWRLAGVDPNSRLRFESLAEAAAEKLSEGIRRTSKGHRDLLNETDPLRRWYKALATVDGALRPYMTGIRRDIDDKGNVVGTARLYTLHRLAETSAVVCTKLRTLYGEPPDKDNITTEKIRRWLLNNRVVAVGVIAGVALVGIAGVITAWDTIAVRLGFDGTAQSRDSTKDSTPSTTSQHRALPRKLEESPLVRTYIDKSTEALRRNDIARAREFARAAAAEAKEAKNIGALGAVAVLYESMGQDDARDLYALAVTVAETEVPDGAELAQALEHLAFFDSFNSEPEKAESLYERALQIWTKLGKAGGPETLTALRGLAEAKAEQQNCEQAEALYDRILAIDRTASPDPRMAMAFFSCGATDRAIVLLESLVGEQKGNPSSLDMLGWAYQQKGDLPRARSTYEREIAEVQARSKDDSSPALIQPLEHLGAVLQQQRDYDAAERILRRALAIEENRPRRHQMSNQPLSRALQNLASVLVEQEKYVEAEELEKRSIALLEDGFGKTTRVLVGPLNRLAELYRTLKRYSDAEELYKRSIGIIPSPDTLDRYASLLHDLNRSSEAEKLSLQAKTIQERMAHSASDPDQRNR